MDKTILLQEEIQTFIKAHENDDLPTLVLQKKYVHLPLKEIAGQIKCRRKAARKLPLWYNTDGVLFPQPVSVEQSSSEITAQFKAQLFSGKSSVDITGGLGVDSFYLAKQFTQHTYVETKKDLLEVAQHNFGILKVKNIRVIEGSAEKFLEENKEPFDLVYIDPDRRPENKKVAGFTDSKPDLLKMLPSILAISKNVMVKASPMLDITKGIQQLKQVYQVIILALNNEVKELLFLIKREKVNDIKISCVNLINGEEQVFEYYVSELQQEDCRLRNPLHYLYEPNAAIMKAGGYDLLGSKFNLLKLAKNTHLFTSKEPINGFPGRSFKIIGQTSYNKRQNTTPLSAARANISTRNFPDSPDKVKKKLGLKDGGEQYLFGCRNMHNKPVIIICEKF